MKKLFYLVSITILVTLIGCKVKELTPEQQQKVSERTESIEQKRYTFTATQANLPRGGAKHLSPGYTLKVSNDTLDVYLPFFGRAYTAPIGQNEGGFKFVSTDFDYTMNEKKAGEYEIQIKPNDIQGSYNTGVVLRLNLYNNGNASLSINSTNRETMNFYGTFERNGDNNKKH